MAFLHCHNCGWEQDDFWAKDGYNPLNSLKDDIYLDWLFQPKVHSDIEFIHNTGLPYEEDDEGPYVDGRKMVAYVLRNHADLIENMVVRTDEEFQSIRDTFVCPKCGRGDQLDID